MREGEDVIAVTRLNENIGQSFTYEDGRGLTILFTDKAGLFSLAEDFAKGNTNPVLRELEPDPDSLPFTQLRPS